MEGDTIIFLHLTSITTLLEIYLSFRLDARYWMLDTGCSKFEMSLQSLRSSIQHLASSIQLKFVNDLLIDVTVL